MLCPGRNLLSELSEEEVLGGNAALRSRRIFRGDFLRRGAEGVPSSSLEVSFFS